MAVSQVFQREIVEVPYQLYIEAYGSTEQNAMGGPARHIQASGRDLRAPGPHSRGA